MDTKKIIATIIREHFNENKSIVDLINKLTENYEIYKEYIDKEYKLVKVIYIRFGLPRTNNLNKIVSSKRHVFGKEVDDETGVSVFEVFWDGKNIWFVRRNSSLNSSFDELWYQKRKIYLLDGEIDYMEEGADGEPIMKPNTVKVMAEIPRELILKT